MGRKGRLIRAQLVVLLTSLLATGAVPAVARTSPRDAAAARAQVQSQAQAQAPASVPPSLQALEQKMAQIRFNTA
jgi:hypothetical protein